MNSDWIFALRILVSGIYPRQMTNYGGKIMENNVFSTFRADKSRIQVYILYRQCSRLDSQSFRYHLLKFDLIILKLGFKLSVANFSLLNL